MIRITAQSSKWAVPRVTMAGFLTARIRRYERPTSNFYAYLFVRQLRVEVEAVDKVMLNDRLSSP